MNLAAPVIVAAKDNPAAEGILVAMGMVSTPVKEINPETNKEEINIVHRVLCGVCWNDQRSPAISMHDADDLEWLEVPGVTDLEDELDEDDEGLEPEEHNPNPS